MKDNKYMLIGLAVGTSMGVGLSGVGSIVALPLGSSIGLAVGALISNIRNR